MQKFLSSLVGDFSGEQGGLSKTFELKLSWMISLCLTRNSMSITVFQKFLLIFLIYNLQNKEHFILSFPDPMHKSGDTTCFMKSFGSVLSF